MRYGNFLATGLAAAAFGVLIGVHSSWINGYLVFHGVVAAFLVLFTSSRGMTADILFALFWPFYLFAAWKSGEL